MFVSLEPQKRLPIYPYHTIIPRKILFIYHWVLVVGEEKKVYNKINLKRKRGRRYEKNHSSIF